MPSTPIPESLLPNDALGDQSQSCEHPVSLLSVCRSSSSSCCTENYASLARSFALQDTDDAGQHLEVCGCALSGKMQALALTTLLFSVITSAQTLGAVFAHSEALLADCSAMWVDCMTYVLNLIAEMCECYGIHRWMILTIPLISLSCLLYVTSSVAAEAIKTLSAGDNDDEDVNPYIVLGFAVWCVSFDSISLYTMAKMHFRKERPQINMLAAAAHTSADLARSLTTSIESILIMFFGFDSVSTDAWSCLVVSSIIFAGSVFPFWEWAKTFIQFLRH